MGRYKINVHKSGPLRLPVLEQIPNYKFRNIG